MADKVVIITPEQLQQIVENHDNVVVNKTLENPNWDFPSFLKSEKMNEGWAIPAFMAKG